MPSDNEILLPDWLFMPEEEVDSHQTSTTTAGFSPQRALEGNKPFAPIIPNSVEKTRRKKRIILNDYTLRHVNASVLVNLMTPIDWLLALDFKIFYIDDIFGFHALDEKTLHDLSNFRKHSDDYPLSYIHNNDSDYTQDGTVILNYRRLRDLYTHLFNQDLDFSIHRPLYGENYVDNLNTIVTQSSWLYQENDEPEVVLDELVLDELLSTDPTFFSRKGRQRTISRYIIADVKTLKRCLEMPAFPKEMIVGLQIDLEKDYVLYAEIVQRYTFPHVTKLWVDNAGDYDRRGRLSAISEKIFPNLEGLSYIKDAQTIYNVMSNYRRDESVRLAYEQRPINRRLHVLLPIDVRHNFELVAEYMELVSSPNAIWHFEIDPNYHSFTPYIGIEGEFAEKVKKHSKVISMKGSVRDYFRCRAHHPFLSSLDLDVTLNPVELPDKMDNKITHLRLNITQSVTSYQLIDLISHFPLLGHLSIHPRQIIESGDLGQYLWMLEGLLAYFTGISPNKHLQNEILRAVLFTKYYCSAEVKPAIIDKAFETLLNAINPPATPALTRAAPDPHFIYDTKTINTGITLSEKPHHEYIMLPLCVILQGGESFSEVRRAVFTVRSRGANSLNHENVSPEPLFANALPPAQGLRSTHQFNFDCQFVFINGLYCCSLPNFTRFDRITEYDPIPAGMHLRYSTSNDFYYLTSKSRPSQDIKFSYKLHAVKTKAQPSYEQLALHYRKTFNPNFPAHQARTLAHAQAHPEYYDCGQRTVAFLDKYKNSPIRGACSGSHSWIETPDGTVDLGGGGNYTVTYVNPPPKVAEKNPYFVETMGRLTEILNESGRNTVLIFNSQQQLEKTRLLIIHLLEHLIVVDQFSDIQTLAPYLSVSPEGASFQKPPGGWLIEQLKKTTHRAMLFDWAGFSARQAAQSNTLLDKLASRKVQFTPIPAHYHQISLVVKGDPLQEDYSFLSRHGKNRFLICASAIEDLPKPQIIPKTGGTLEVELYQSVSWFDLLFGKLELNGAMLEHKATDLLKNNHHHLVIKNPPSNDPKFDRLIAHLRQGHPFRFYDQTLKLDPMTVEFQHGYDFSDLADCVLSITSNLTDLDLATLQIDHYVTPSTFERCLSDTFIKDRQLHLQNGWIADHPAKELSIYLTRSLSDQQICALVNELKRCSKKAVLFCAPDVVIPPDLLREVRHHDNRSQNIRPPSKIILSEDLKESDWVIDVSGRSPDDLLYGYEVDAKCLPLQFEEKLSDVWTALSSGRTVYLTGSFSGEMADHLSTLLVESGYLWHEHAKESFKGKLFLSPSEPIPTLDWIRRADIFVDLKPLERSVKHLKVEDPFRRKQTVLDFLDENPALFIHGAPGVGKSSFVHELIDEKMHAIYSENQLIDWALDTNARATKSILALDEATIRGLNLSIFNGLLTKYPHLVIKNKVYPIYPHQKVILLGNKTAEMHPFFGLLSSLEFAPLTEDYISTKVLSPILGSLALAKDFYKDNQGLSLRAMHAAAIAHRSLAQPLHQLPAALRSFTLTKSRTPVLKSLISSLNSRHFMRQAMQSPAQYGGKTGVWLEGPPGIGKTQIMRAVLTDLHYQEGLDYLILPANMDADSILSQLREAFQQGMIVVIDELDTVLTPELTAEINSTLMGEDLNFKRPIKPGFTLWATGNGRTYRGRCALPDSIQSRMDCQVMDQYPTEECAQICGIPTDHPLLIKHCNDPRSFTFRELVDSVQSLASSTPAQATAQVWRPSQAPAASAGAVPTHQNGKCVIL